MCSKSLSCVAFTYSSRRDQGSDKRGTIMRWFAEI
jgi:hypothetical protein